MLITGFPVLIMMSSFYEGKVNELALLVVTGLGKSSWGCLVAVMLPAPAVVEPMCADDKEDGKGEESELIIWPYLFGYQAAHAGSKEQPGSQTMMMAVETMPEGGGSDGEGQGDHSVFEEGVVEDIDPQDGEGGHQQGKDCAVDGTEYRSGDAQGVQVELSEHGATKLRILQQRCKL